MACSHYTVCLYSQQLPCASHRQPGRTVKNEIEHHVGHADTLEPELPLAAEGVVRYVWHGRFGDVLIEVLDGQVLVNGDAVHVIQGEAVHVVSGEPPR